MSKKKTFLNYRKLLQKTSRCVSTLIKPLRIFQFFTVLLLFATTIYIIVMDPTPINAIACIVLITLSGVYIFVLAIELISHFAGSGLHIIPMTIFSLLGLLFFAAVGIFLIFKAYTHFIVIIIIIVLCLLAALLFLIDITMVFAFWKRRCLICEQCCSDNLTELTLRKANRLNVLETQIMRHDVTTSLSDIRVPRELEDVATLLPEHCYRKVGYSQRREYIDCPTCVPSLCNLDVAEIQTESKKISVVESQTPRAITKETPMQTSSKCEFCHQYIQLPSTVGDRVPNAHCLQHPQWSYPAIVQFLRGEVSMPCCSKCKCITDTTQTQQLQPLKHTKSLSKGKSNLHKMTSTESKNNATKMTTQPTSIYIASVFEPDKKMQTALDIDYKQKVAATEIKKDITEGIDQKIAEKIKLSKTKESDIIEKIIVGHENVKERNKSSMEGSEEKIIDEKNKIERIKGGGGERSPSSRIYQEFKSVMEQESINLKESIHTSRILNTPLSNRTKPRTLLHLKSNKVDPITDANVSVINEDCIPERMASRTILDNQNIQESEHSARNGTPNPITEHQLNAACSLYKRQKSLTPTLDNSRYYIVFKDKKGRYFCEFCAPLESRKITSRFEGTDSRKLRCASCRLHFRDRGIRTKSNTCPKYSRLQKHMASPSTT